MLWLVLDIKSTGSGPEHHGLVLNTCFCLLKPLSHTSAGFKLTNVDVLSRIFITSLAARSLLHIKVESIKFNKPKSTTKRDLYDDDYSSHIKTAKTEKMTSI